MTEKAELGHEINIRIAKLWTARVPHDLLKYVLNNPVDITTASIGLIEGPVGTFASIFSFIINIKNACNNGRWLEGISYNLVMYARSGNCPNAEQMIQLNNELIAFAEKYRAKLLTSLAIDLTALAGGVKLLAASVISKAAAAGVVASVGVTAASLYYGNSIATEFNQKIYYFGSEKFRLIEQCKKHQQCNVPGKCLRCGIDYKCTVWPLPNKEPRYPKTKPTLDPSGFVYAGVESNRLEGVTTTVFYKETKQDVFGDDVEYVYM